MKHKEILVYRYGTNTHFSGSCCQIFFKLAELLEGYKMSNLCDFKEISMCRSRAITWNTRKYLKIGLFYGTKAYFTMFLLSDFL